MPLPCRVKFLLSWSNRARNLDKRAEHSQASGAQQAELLSGHLTHDRRQFPGAELIAGDTQKVRSGWVKSRARRECGRVIHRREVHALVRVAPVQDSLPFEENERHLTGQHIGKRTVEDRGH